MNRVLQNGGPTLGAEIEGESPESVAAGWAAEQPLRKQVWRLTLERDLAIVERERALSELAALRSLIGSLRAS
ncbi:hypothetical protein [Marinobacter mobilis]|uniref:Uncharacterized protein n=2 Tax=Marinobacter mobilis TaxID=488533 RepID=A0A1H2SJN8_9GAMM|nr:hypothetical protein SAMN04487960_102146 [Marinobacter mobilis]